MKLFNRKSKQKKEAVNVATDKLSALIVRRTIRFQQSWAAFMQRHTDKISLTLQRYLLVSFSLVAFACCMYIIASSLINKGSRPFPVTVIHTPVHIPGEQKATPAIVSEKEFQQIQYYKKYMDSCGLLLRPGLKDSIQQLEKIYESTKR